MRIAVDLQACQNTSRGRGIARYALALTRALCRAGSGHDVSVLLNGAFPGTVDGVRGDLEGCVAPQDIHVMALRAETACAYPANAWRTRAAELLRTEAAPTMHVDLDAVLAEGRRRQNRRSARWLAAGAAAAVAAAVVESRSMVSPSRSSTASAAMGVGGLIATNTSPSGVAERNSAVLPCGNCTPSRIRSVVTAV